MKRILYATDFSRGSLAAFQWAIDLARREKARLIVVHVVSPPVSEEASRHIAADVCEKLAAAIDQEIKARLTDLEGQARRQGVSARALLLRGAATEEILRAASKLRVTRVVLGTHGRSGSSSGRLGSVATGVASDAACPVVTVRI